MNQTGKALTSGVAAAGIITLLHETLRQFVPQAPRMERMGMQAIEQLMNAMGQPAPSNKNMLYGQALAGEITANSLYYSVAGMGNKPWLTGLLAGVTAGVAAVTLPKQMGLEEQYANRTPETTAMTIALYTLGGLVAGGVASILTEKNKPELNLVNHYNPELNDQQLVERNKKRSWKLKD